ncbi:MAG TPA: hypothetical protein EYP40_10800 [Chromatiales bacterium]|nr:hypothetical protein [Chromatiales bacterium]
MRDILFFLVPGFPPVAISKTAERLEIRPVTGNVSALVGQHGPMSKWNFGANATFDAVVTSAARGGDIQDVRSLNEYPLSPFERLIGYDMLMVRNSLHVYLELEWE